LWGFALTPDPSPKGRGEKGVARVVAGKVQIFFADGHNYGFSLYNGRLVGFTIEVGVNLMEGEKTPAIWWGN